MMQVYRLLNFLDRWIVNLLAMGIYYIFQAIGVSIIAFLFIKYPTIASGRRLPLFISISIVICLAIAIFSFQASIVIISGTLLNLMVGGLSACYLTRLSTDIPKKRRGLVFGVAYFFW